MIATFGGLLPFHYLALAIIGKAIFIVLIGVLQLRQDNRLSEKSFVELVKKESTITQAVSVPLVIEIVSSNWKTDYSTKADEYESMGIP
ncbi:hypothetical protein ACOWPH_21805 [Anabaena sp. PCC 7938]|uniref:hypothetical protein n=1 Tax=Anabaena TaxID=1163 RepID=UPI0002E1C78A|nr:hypothetical protein NIES19_12750 [Anabaena cylindrica PCC 7122]